jgi:hypothetical protein
VPIDPGPRNRPEDADEEVLNTCRELSLLSSQDVTLVTGDTGMRLRAQALRLRYRREQVGSLTPRRR